MDGIVLVDKPAGRTSHDVTTWVRRRLGVRRAGHAGTLDPFATGLLIVLVGRARRTQRFFTALPKEYEALARFGAVSTTGDPDGVITPTGVLPEGPLALPTGRIRQRPPAYSAVRLAGVRAYERARRGERVDVPEREVTVYAFEERWRERDRAGLRIVCSSGTYVRSLVTELGDAYCEELRRTRIGPFSVGEADPDRLIPLAEALSFLPALEVAGDQARRAAHGLAIAPAREPRPAAWEPPDPPGLVLLLDEAGAVALAEPREGGVLKPVVGFRA